VPNFSSIEIMLKYFIQQDDTLVVNNPWECFQPNSKVEKQEGIRSSGGRNSSRLPLSILAKNAFSFKLFSSLDLKSSVRFLMSALMAIRSSMRLQPHLSSYMSINSSLWYNLGGKNRKTQFSRLKILASQMEISLKLNWI